MDNLPGVSEIALHPSEQEVPQAPSETPRINTEVTHPFEDKAARKIEEAFRDGSKPDRESNQGELKEEAHVEGQQLAQNLQEAVPRTPSKEEPVIIKPIVPVPPIEQPIIVKPPAAHDLNNQGLIFIEQRKRELEVAKNKQ